MDTLRNPTRCPYCGRVMSWREESEQAACDDCHRFYKGPEPDIDPADLHYYR